MKSLVRLSISYPKSAIIIIILLTIPFLCFIAGMEKEDDPLAILSPDNPSKKYYQYINDYFDHNEVIIVGFESGKGIFNLKTLEKIKRLTDKFENITLVNNQLPAALDKFVKVSSGRVNELLNEIVDNGITRADIKTVTELANLLENSEPDNKKLFDLITNLKVQLYPLEKVKSLFTEENVTASGNGISVNKLIERVPQSPVDLLKARNTIISNDIYEKIYITADEDKTLFALEIDFSVLGSDNLILLYQKIKDIVDDETGEDKMYIGGLPVIWVWEILYIDKDMKLLLPIIILAVIAVLFLFFRKAQAIYLPLLIVSTSVVWSIGLMAVCGIRLSIIGSAIPVILIAVGTADAIHILSHYYKILENGCSAKEALSLTMDRLSIPIVMTSLTTMVGFGALSVSEIRIISEFGMFTAFGILAAMFFSLTIIPAALTLSKNHVNVTSKSRHISWDGLFNKWGYFICKYKWFILPVILFMFGGACFGTSKLSMEYSPKGLFKAATETSKAHEFIDNYFAGTTGLSLVIETGEDDALKDPALLTKLDLLQTKIKTDKHVGKLISVIDYIKRMNYVMNEEDENFNRLPRVEEIVEETDWVMQDGKEEEITKLVSVDGRDLISQYLLLYESAGGEEISKTIDSTYKTACINILFDNDQSAYIKQMIKTIKGHCLKILPESIKVSFAGLSTLSIVIMETIVKSQIYSILISICTILIVVIILFKSAAFGFLGVLPLCFTLLCNFSIMVLVNVSLDVGTSIVGSIAIGIGIDYCIHFIFYMHRENKNGYTLNDSVKRTLSGIGKPILQNAMLVAIGFIVLVFSNYVPLIHFGWLGCLTMIICSVSTLIIIPTVLMVFSSDKAI